MPLTKNTVLEGDRSQTYPHVLRCVVMDNGTVPRAHLNDLAADSRYRFNFVKTGTIAEARAALNSGTTDVLVVNSHAPDNEAMDRASELASEAHLNAVPVIVLSDAQPSHDTAVRTMRCGAADYLWQDDLTPEKFDEAIESALRRTHYREADEAAIISNLTAETETLRRIALRNMRLLKGQALPLIAFAWRTVAGGTVTPEQREQMAGRVSEVVEIRRRCNLLMI